MGTEVLWKQEELEEEQHSSPSNGAVQGKLRIARQTPLTCYGHTRPVVDLDFSPTHPTDGYFLISSCKDGNPILRKGDTGDWIGTFKGHKGAVWCSRLSSNTFKALTGSADFTAKLWDTRNGKELHSFAHNHIVRAVSFSQDNRHLITGGMEKFLRIYDSEKTSEVVKLEGHTAAIKCISRTTNENLILSAADDKTLKVWDVRQNKVVQSLGSADPITNITLSFDGKTIVTTAGRKITFWKSDSVELIKSFDMPFDALSASLHKDGEEFAVGGNDFYVHICEYSTGNELDVFKGHHGAVHSVLYSPDGHLFASGSEDGNIRLWQTVPGKVYGLWQGPITDEAQ